MANKRRRRKRKLKPFTKVLMVLIPCFVVVGVIYGIDINKTNDNKTPDIKLDTKINNDNIVKDSNTQDNNTSVDDSEVDPNDIYGILESIAKTDYRYKEVLANKEMYPEKLLEMLSRNKDMISYMYDFEDKKGHIYIDNIGKVTKGEYPLLLLDDIFSELDINNRNKIINYLNKDIQVFITSTDINDIEEKIIKNAQVFKIKDKSIV